MNSFSRFIFALPVLLLFGTVSLAQDSATPMRMLAESQVSNRGIFFSDVADNVGNAGTIRIGDAPQFGRSIVLLRSQVAEMVHHYVPEIALTNWSGAARIRISRKTQPLGEAMLKELLTSTLQREVVRDRGDLEVRLMRPWSTIPVPDEPLSIRVLELPNAGVTPNFIVRFEIQASAQSIGTWQVPLQARVFHDIWVARTAIPRGQLLQANDWVAEKRDILLLRDAVGGVRMNDDSYELTENISAGAPLLSRYIKARAVVRRGKLIEAVLQDGQLVISVKAEALEDGVMGQTIRVRNIASRREFRGKVENEQTIVVNL
jgi:flagella basal body P-ring formation protein FlgA